MSQSWRKRILQGIFNMLTGGKIFNQPSQIPHQSLPISPLVILPSVSPAPSLNFETCRKCKAVLSKSQTNCHQRRRLAKSIQGSLFQSAAVKIGDDLFCSSAIIFFPNCQLAVKLDEMTFFAYQLFFHKLKLLSK